ncbi:TRAPP I, II and III complex subunit Trs31 [Schizosaccharomyces osmophilus]|uniref:Trafficking protein particle complex subunit n=1 Tax=Schizosaccharomyces osmophilus TaxID=2545709 RepID=A0AAF0ARQ7_9SCHI|nr:TRAPP I, II and III complex subunit Trs31 [Schizosaccharomyces osmophilus]WBW70591.1 TRAPP I, II and III complex subunit Trs31 [Schizosaccharomyces osmophilus]
MQSHNKNLFKSSVSESLTSTAPLLSKNIYDQTLNRIRNAEVNLSCFAFLFSELIQRIQSQVSGIQEFEEKLNEHGYRVGQRLVELVIWRERNPRREIRILNILQYIHSTLWKYLFGRHADSLEKSKENEDEYMIVDNNPLFNKFISVPKEMSQLNCCAYLAGIVEGFLDSAQFPCKASAHTVPLAQHTQRTVILIKIHSSVLAREEIIG